MHTIPLLNKSHFQILLEVLPCSDLMCERHTCDCPVCGKEYLIFVKICPHYQLGTGCSACTTTVKEDMIEGLCPSPVCPNSRSGGCVVS